MRVEPDLQLESLSAWAAAAEFNMEKLRIHLLHPYQRLFSGSSPVQRVVGVSGSVVLGT